MDNERKITIKHVRKKYPEKYKHLSDRQLQKKIDLFYQISYISITDSQNKLREENLKIIQNEKQQTKINYIH